MNDSSGLLLKLCLGTNPFQVSLNNIRKIKEGWSLVCFVTKKEGNDSIVKFLLVSL